MRQAVRIIRDEHRALAAVVHGLLYFARRAKEGVEPNFRLMWTMVRYVADFPQTFHHPKEETCLFDRLAGRTPEAETVLAELRRQHLDDFRLLADIKAALGDYEGGAANGAARLVETVERFADLTWAHMHVEEAVLLPLAEAHLGDADWAEIDAAFGANGDPRFGADAADGFHQMFRTILEQAPAPIGLA